MVEHDIYEWTHKHRFDKVLKLCNINKDYKILEVGIEPCIFSEKLLKRKDDISLYGIGYGDGEKSTKQILGQDVEIRNCNVETDRWPYDDGEFDVVIMMAILEHLFDPVSALIEARRVLADDGSFIASTPNAVNLAKRLTTVAGHNPFDDYSLESRYNRHQHEYTEKELKNLLSICGLEADQLCTVVENRKRGIPRVVQYISKIYPSFGDQLVVRCVKGKPRNELPIVYRKGLTEETDEHPSLTKYN